MAVIATETWTGANGAAWPAQWTTTAFGLDAGATADIQGNRGRLQPAASAWAGGTRMYLAGMAVTADADYYLEFSSPAFGGAYFIVGVRADDVPINATDPSNGYVVTFGEGSARMDKRVAGAATELGRFAFAGTNSTNYAVRIQTQGSTLRVRAWAVGGAEPTSWNWTGTDTSLASGKVWLAASNGGSSFTSWSVDNLSINTLAAPPNSAPTANAGADQSAVEPWSTVTLTATASDSDGTTPTISWAQTAGSPAVTLSGSGATRTFQAPGTIAGTTLTFTATASDGSLTGTDSMTVTVLPVTERAAVGGVMVPMRIRTIGG